ncbi:MAG: methyltransferase domain-containing protein [Proteobacteria bacterium]|nr:methyltransferase domain-containing protein [Pseudomonadota bacterium]
MSEQYTGSENLEVMLDAVNYNGYLRQLVREHAADSRTALDFGAGIGTFTTAIDLPAGEIVCVEPDRRARQQLSDQGYQVVANIEEVSRRDLDYIFSLNVLEHIEDDAAAMEAIFRRLRPGGRLFIYVPAFDHLRTSMDDLVGHYRRYTRRSLTQVVAGAGFVVEKSAYTDFLGYFATLLFSLMDRFRSSPDGRLSKPLLIFYDRVCFPFSRLLSVIFQRLAGKNVYIVARKPVTDP